MPRLFSYGTLRQDNVQMAQFGRLLKGAPDTLPGWKREMVEITDAHVLAKSGERFHPIWWRVLPTTKWRAWCSRSARRSLPLPTAMKWPTTGASRSGSNPAATPGSM